MGKPIDDSNAGEFTVIMPTMGDASDPLHGVLLVDKPVGLTSARVVDRIKRLLPRGTKIGHAGTLDPFATGLLVLLVGKATRACEQVMGMTKTYEATIKLGATTPTDDPESPEIPTPGGTRPVSIEPITDALREFVGSIHQIPPVYSALKVGGRRAADRARSGQVVQMQPRIVRVDSIEVLTYDGPMLHVRVACGRGTYIRAIARDLGARLGVGGYLTQLRRTRIGPYDVANAVKLDNLPPIEALIRSIQPIATERV
jgi:tRNA pseudouridine55 synthase